MAGALRVAEEMNEWAFVVILPDRGGQVSEHDAFPAGVREVPALVSA